MLVSNYTFTVYNGKDFFLYNSLSNALLQVDEDTYHRLSNWENVPSILFSGYKL